jgi:hypothetical protein
MLYEANSWVCNWWWIVVFVITKKTGGLLGFEPANFAKAIQILF